jgi:site-specific DNA recombinase
MSPSHANKQGVRYRYYVSQALIQGRKQEAGAVARVSAPDLEERILAELKTLDRDEGTSGRELVSRLVERITLQEDRIEIRLQQAAAGSDLGMTAPEGGTLMLIPWVRRQAAVRQVTSLPSRRAISLQTREALLRAIARARLCAEALARGGEADLAAMAEREGLSERYLRVQLPLAFLSPKVVDAIASGTICADVTLTRLWSAQPLSWTQQEEQLLGFACV